LSSGQAQCTTSSLGEGSHAIVATYAGDSANSGSLSATLTQVMVTVPVIVAGDINGDGMVDISDVLKILQIAVGLTAATSDDYPRADMAPLVDGQPSPDGIIDISDALVVLEKTVGLMNW